MSDTEELFDWDWPDDPEEEIVDLENAARIKFNLCLDDERVQLAASDLTVGMDGNKTSNKTHMADVLLNLYRQYLLDTEKWTICVLRKGNYELVFRYNRNRIAWTSLKRVVDDLKSNELIDYVRGVFFRNMSYDEGKCTRIRAKAELITLLEGKYGFTKDIVQKHQDEEVIILKDKNKKPLDYEDNNRNQAARMRRFVHQYNKFLQRTYLDLDAEGFKPKEKLTIDLSARNVYRIFNNRSFTQGGRFYGGWWEGIPSALRLKIIINAHKVVEFDYSGVHIHLLYANNGLDYSVYDKDAYQLPDYPQTPKMRRLFKELLLAALNACPTEKLAGKERARRALRLKITRKPDEFPEDLPDLKQAIDDFSEYHEQISHEFYTGVGLKLMYTDSLIAEDVLRTMMNKNIPVLPVHDSFVCPKLHEDDLYQAMKNSYQKHCKFDISKRTEPVTSKTVIPGITIKEDELDRGIEYPSDLDVEYHYDLNSIKDEALLRQMLLYGEHELTETDIKIVLNVDGTVTRRLPSIGEG